MKRPEFEISENTIKMTHPVFEEKSNLTEDERKIYKVLRKTMLISISEIAPYAPFGDMIIILYVYNREREFSGSKKCDCIVYR